MARLAPIKMYLYQCLYQKILNIEKKRGVAEKYNWKKFCTTVESSGEYAAIYEIHAAGKLENASVAILNDDNIITALYMEQFLPEVIYFRENGTVIQYILSISAFISQHFDSVEYFLSETQQKEY